MEIRNCRFNEVKDVIQLLKDTGLFFESCDQECNIQNKITADSESIQVIIEDNKIVGTIFIVFDIWASILYHLCVHPNYHRRGYASLLVEKALEIIKSRGGNEVGGYIEHDNEASLKLFEKYGFQKYLKPTICVFRNI